ncbi:MAG: sigma-54-dependent transcriptional regulator [Thermodesulfobacteriota bacterium]
MKRILLIDDDRNILTTLEIHLEDMGLEVRTAHTGAKGLADFKKWRPEIVFLDLKLPDTDGLAVLQEIIDSGIPSYVVIITAYAAIDTAVKAIKLGAFEYLPKPFTPAQITHLIEMILRVDALESEVRTLRDQLKGVVREGEFITRNQKVRKLLTTARQVADSNANVLISGESGTGKGMLARLIHHWSPRQEAPFITVDCTALQENLLESDLFGHVKGAFTGALRDKAGKLETAAGGTVFLDEISELSPPIQAKLLHFLQHREFEKVGDPQMIRVDVRVIAATNRDLEELVRENLFRQDLFFRINVVEIFMPPLRERPEDIPFLADHYLKRFARENRRPVKKITQPALRRLQAYPWPGNIRELVNVIERGTILCRTDQLTPEDLPPHIADYAPRRPDAGPLKTIEAVERDHIEQVILHTESMEEAARVLGIDPATLWRKRKKYHLD